jgi:desulfoferrodoxin-like iron-binding protein
MAGPYKCDSCGRIVKVIYEGEGELVCCGQPMKPLTGFKSVEEIVDVKRKG